MNKKELIMKLEAAHTGLEESIAPLTPERMIAENAVGTWSVKDVLAHLAVWTARCVTVIFAAEQGQAPEAEDMDRMLDDWEALNTEDYETQKDRSLQQVLGDWRGASRQLIKRLGGWNDNDLFSPTRFAWLRGQSLGEFITNGIADHTRDHETQIRILTR